MLLLAFLLLSVASAVEWDAQFVDHDQIYNVTFNGVDMDFIDITGQLKHTKFSNSSFEFIDTQAFANLSCPRALNYAGRSLTKLPDYLFVNDSCLEELDLSNNNLGHGFWSTELKNVFAIKTKLKTLNLANNSISFIPESVISIFPNLEHLNVSNNFIFQRLNYERLGRLKTLDISNNRVSELTSGYFSGLSKNITITTRGVDLWFIHGRMFENVKTRSSKLPGRRNSQTTWESFKLNFPKWRYSTPVIVEPDENTLSVVCIVAGRLISLENFNNTITTKENCKKYEGQFEKTISVRDLEIETFDRNWYRLRINKSSTLHLDKNKIRHITGEMLNDLPPEIVGVSLQGNMIERLEKEVIENKNPMELLDLSHNNIGEIAEGALEKLNLVGALKLNNNRLRDMKFVDSLPGKLVNFIFHNNEISELAGNLSKFKKLAEIDLSHNKIMQLNAQSLQGLLCLYYLELSNNGLRDIEPDSFKYLTCLLDLHLEYNNLSSLAKGLFDGLNNIESISLHHNKLTDIADGAFSGLRGTLRSLYLNNNKIRSLKSGAFVTVPTENPVLEDDKTMRVNAQSLQGLSSLYELELSNNGLRDIEPDSFKYLTSLLHLNLEYNNLSSLANGSFDGLNDIRFISLDHNKLTEIADGVFSGLPDTLQSLHLNNNEIRILKSGAFVNVPKRDLYLNYNNITDIEPKCFDLLRLDTLYLRGNSLKRMGNDTFQGLGSVTELDLSSNRITTIEKGAIMDMEKLRKLDLSENRIEVLENGALFTQSKTEGIDLRINVHNNPFETIQGGVFDNV